MSNAGWASAISVVVYQTTGFQPVVFNASGILAAGCNPRTTLTSPSDSSELIGTQRIFAFSGQFLMRQSVQQQAGNIRSTVYTCIVSLAGAAVLFYSVYRITVQSVRLDWMLTLVFMALVTWRAEVWIPGVGSKITLSDTFIFVSVLLLGPWASAVLASIDGLARSPRGSTKRRFSTAAVNMAAMNLAVLGASIVATATFGPLNNLISE